MIDKKICKSCGKKSISPKEDGWFDTDICSNYCKEEGESRGKQQWK